VSGWISALNIVGIGGADDHPALAFHCLFSFYYLSFAVFSPLAISIALLGICGPNELAPPMGYPQDSIEEILPY